MAEDKPIFSKGALQDVLNTRDAIKEIQRSMRSAADESESVKGIFKNITQSAEDFAKHQQSARSNTKNTNKLIKEGNDLIARANQLTAMVSTSEEKRQEKLRKINDLYEQAQTQVRGLTGKQKLNLQVLEKEVKEIEKQSQGLMDSANHSKSLAGTYKTLSKESMSMSRNIYGTLGGLSKMLKLDENLTDGFTKANELQRERKIIETEELDLAKRIDDLKAKHIANVKEENKLEENATAEQRRQYDLAVAQAELEVKRDDKSIYTPEALQAANLGHITEGTGGDEAKGKIKTAKQGMSTSKSALGPMKALMKGMGAALKVFGKSMIVLKAIAAVVEMIEYAIFGAQSEAIDLARSMSLGAAGGYQMRTDMLAMTEDISKLRGGIEEMVKFQMEFTKHTGTAARLNADQLDTALLMTKQMGFSNTEAIHLVENFKAAGMGAREGLEALKGSYNQLFNTNKTAMNFNQLMKDITGDTELQYIFQTKGADAAMRNAVAVRRTGLSLSQQRSMAEGTLDFEKTMTNQLELQMLTGKNINMNKAQELALQGKNGAAVAEMQKQLGQLTEKQRQNPLIMNKMLELMGMSREEYMKQQNAIREQQSMELAQQKAKNKFKEQDQFYHDKLLTLGRRSQKEALDYMKKSKRQNAEQAREELKAIEIRIAAENEGFTKEEVRQKSFEEYHATNLNNAKVRAGIAGSEVKDLETQVKAGEALALVMADLKTQLSRLVGTNAIEFLMDGLLDFVARAQEVGFFAASMGFGEGAAAANTADEIRETANLSDEQKVELSNIEAIANPPWTEKLMRVLGVGLNPMGLMNLKIENMIEEGAQNELKFRGIRNRKEQEAKAEAAALKAAIDSKKPRDEDGNIIKTDDFILRPGQAPIKFNKGDLLMGGTQLDKSNGKVEQLLEELLAETKSGKIIKMDTATVGRSLQLNKSKMNY